MPYLPADFLKLNCYYQSVEKIGYVGWSMVFGHTGKCPSEKRHGTNVDENEILSRRQRFRMKCPPPPFLQPVIIFLLFGFYR